MINTTEQDVGLKSTWHHGRDYKIVTLDSNNAALFISGNHRVFLIPADTGKRLEAGLAGMTCTEQKEWAELNAAGWLDDVHRNRLATSTYADGANLAININLTGACNLSCSYCFADGGDYGRIYKKMDLHTVDYIFEFVRKHVTPSNRVRFEFFGGEPLLNFPIIQEICTRSDEVQERDGITFVHRISTNLTVLPIGALDLFAKYHFVVSVSIDGDAVTHDHNRPTKAGKGSFAGIIENCKKVRNASDDITLVARMTVLPTTHALIHDVQSLYEYNIFDYFQIYPASIAPSGGGCNGTPQLVQLNTGEVASSLSNTQAATLSPTLLKEFADLLEIYPTLFQSDNRFRGVLEYERVLEMLIEGKLALGFCGGGGTYFTFSPDDSIMPCHRLVGDTKYQVGTGERGLTEDATEWTLPVDAHPVCSQCWAKYICGGNCRQENHIATGELRSLNQSACHYQQNLVEEVVRSLATSPEVHAPKDRHLDDLFVSCGRPVISSLRGATSPMPANFEVFRLLTQS